MSSGEQLDEIAVGNVVDLFVAFQTRDLTSAEAQAWRVSHVLPAGVGTAQPGPVHVDYWVDDGSVVSDTVSASGVQGQTGVYEATIVVDDTMLGIFAYSGYSVDGSSNPLARTAPRRFRVVPSGPSTVIPG